MTSAIEILEEHFGELELLVCAWPECEVGAWEQDADGVRWCETHIDPENLHPLWVDPAHTGHGACARCGELVVTQAVNEPVQGSGCVRAEEGLTLQLPLAILPPRQLHT
jgi:hypothetical protein